MVSQISFAGTYKVSFNNQDPDLFSKFQEYALSKESEDGVRTSLKDKFVKKGGFGNFGYEAERTLIVPDYMDKDVERYCAYNGISYKKFETKDLLEPKSVLSRIALPPKGYKKVYINTEKLEKLAENQLSNLDHCRSDYDKYYSGSVNALIRNGDEIPATRLYIHSPSGNDDLQRYISNFGTEGLNNNQILINFNQETNNPDHCVYFALKDMGIDSIPVYVNSQTYKAGKILGLF